MVERKVKKRTMKTSPKRTRKTSPKRTRKTSPKRTRKTSPKRTRKTSPRRKRRTKSKRLNPGYLRRLYDDYAGRYGIRRQTGRVTEEFSGSLETEEELQRRLLLERAAQTLSVRYHNTYLTNYDLHMVNARTKAAQRLLLQRFELEMRSAIRIQNQRAINGLSLGESRTVRSMALQMVLNMISEQYRL